MAERLHFSMIAVGLVPLIVIVGCVAVLSILVATILGGLFMGIAYFLMDHIDP